MTLQHSHPEPASTVPPRVVAVVVTFNRRDLLPLTLQGIAGAKLQPDVVVVINNASTDGTAEYLDSLDYELPLDIVHLSQNVGGAGGFTVGIDRALARHQADLVWVMDDDTEPCEDTLFESVKAWSTYQGPRGEKPAFVASKVVWDDGRDHPMNTMRTKFGASQREKTQAAQVGARPIRSASFVSLLMDAQVMRREGLPIADFFIWNDDFEYSTRLAHHRYAIAAPASVAKHHTKTFGTTNANPGPRFYNDVRNKLWTFGRTRTLSPLEKFLYGGSVARLWISTLRQSDSAQQYSQLLFRGIKDACTAFRSNEQVLAGIYELESTQLPQQLRAHNGNHTEDFSILMSTYRHDRPEYLHRAIASNLQEQTLTPTEFVLVQDGPLTDELEDVINEWAQKSQRESLTDFKVVKLAKNSGLAQALNFGLQHCSYELVARADADDISEPNRFEMQIPLMASSTDAVLGSSMYEISEDGQTVEATRIAVLGADAIAQTLSSRNPLYHPTVVMRRSAVLSVGGYEEVPGAEDYWLWSRLSHAGFSLNNISEPLVKYRTGAGAYQRRGGLSALLADFTVQRRLYSGGVVNAAEGARNLAVRSVYRMLPTNTRQKVFRQFNHRITPRNYPREE